MEYQKSALQDIRVVSLTKALTGPLCTTLLADMGCDAIKIEQPVIGDETHYWAPLYKNESAYNLGINRNLKSITLNIKKKEGIEILKRLISKADIFIENMRPGVMKKLGLDYEKLQEINPSLIMTSISGFGQDGPYAKRPAYDIIAQAMSGLMGMTGYPDGPPTRVGPAISDVLGALFAVYGTLTALYHRQITGEGQYIDVSMCEATINSLESVFTNNSLLGIEAQRMGSRIQTVAPYNCYKAEDGYFVIGICNDQQWSRLAEVMGENVLNHPEYLTNLARVKNVEKVDTLISEWAASKTVGTIVEKLNSVQVPCAPVNKVSDVLKDPHFIARNIFEEVEYEQVGRFKVVGVVPKLSRTPGKIWRNPPKMGEHNSEIFGKLLGISPDDIKKLEKSEVI